jgi:hypothetical protein
MLAAVIGDAGTVLVHADDGRIDHLHRRIMCHRQGIHDLIPDASASPANKAVITSRRGTKTVWQVAPWCA